MALSHRPKKAIAKEWRSRRSLKKVMVKKRKIFEHIQELGKILDLKFLTPKSLVTSSLFSHEMSRFPNENRHQKFQVPKFFLVTSTAFKHFFKSKIYSKKR